MGSFALAGVLLYLALRGVDLSRVGTALRQADYRWLAPLLGTVVVAHLLRAWRWQILLEALPSGRAGKPRRVPLKTSFYSVLIGYMANYVAPRLGEVARTANLATRAKLPFGGVFGTVVVERVLDVAVLAAALLSTFALLAGQFAALNEHFLTPAQARLGALPLGWLVLIGGGAAVLLAVLAYVAARNERLAKLWRTRLRPSALSFGDGLLTLLRARRRGALLLSTLAMWACYAVMAYLPLVMLGTAEAYGLGLADAWCLMALGALGVVVPSPGGTGSYHYITIQAMVYLFGVPEAPAATYAVLTHGAQFALYLALGLLALLLQGTGLATLLRRRAPAEAPASHEDDATR